MLTFFPGPSKVADHMAGLYTQAFAEDIAFISHRSKRFEESYAFTVAQIREKLAVPADYQIFFLSSATEGWEVLTQSLIQQSALHLHSGAFGAKWAEYARKLKPGVDEVPFAVNEDPTLLLGHLRETHEALCLTHNETSNATLLETSLLEDARHRLGERLLCMDATSSMAGIALPWTLADVWYASVQKCFGQPAGLAVLVCGPRALAKAAAVGDTAHYNSLLTIAKHAENNQTSYTPNVLAIHVLGRHLALTQPVALAEAALRARAQRYYAFVDAHPLLRPLVTRTASQSPTVVAIEAAPETQARMKAAAQEAGILLGAGYGPWKASTFRIANFPAYTDADQDRLLTVLDTIR